MVVGVDRSRVASRDGLHPLHPWSGAADRVRRLVRYGTV